MEQSLVGIYPCQLGGRDLQHLGKQQMLTLQLTGIITSKSGEKTLVEQALTGGLDLHEQQALLTLKEKVAFEQLPEVSGVGRSRKLEVGSWSNRG